MKPLEPGFYWIQDEWTPFPVVARYVSDGRRWYWPGVERAILESDVTVLSARLEPPK